MCIIHPIVGASLEDTDASSVVNTIDIYKEHGYKDSQMNSPGLFLNADQDASKRD